MSFGRELRKDSTPMLEMKVPVREIEMNVKICGDDSLPVIVFLHGFTGSVNTWT